MTAGGSEDKTSGGRAGGTSMMGRIVFRNRILAIQAVNGYPSHSSVKRPSPTRFQVLTFRFLRLQVFVNGLLPEVGVAQPNGSVHPDVFQKQRQHVEPLLVRPEHPAFDQFDFLRAQVTVFLLDLGTVPLAPRRTIKDKAKRLAYFCSISVRFHLRP